MGSNVPQIEPIFATSKRSQMELSKALASLGFGAWNDLEPESDKKSTNLELSIKKRLNTALNSKLMEIEQKREKALLIEKKLAKMAEGPEKRKLLYQKQQQENYQRKNKKSPIDEERCLHESYQILLKECDMRRIRREREAERLNRAESQSSGRSGSHSSPLTSTSGKSDKSKKIDGVEPGLEEGEENDEDFSNLLASNDSVF